MREAGRCEVPTLGTRSFCDTFFVQLGRLYQILDEFLLGSSLVADAPPRRTVVFAFELEVTARLARRPTFIALFSSKATSVTT